MTDTLLGLGLGLGLGNLFDANVGFEIRTLYGCFVPVPPDHLIRVRVRVTRVFHKKLTTRVGLGLEEVFVFDSKSENSRVRVKVVVGARPLDAAVAVGVCY